MTERDRLELRGLLPPNIMTDEQQIERFSMLKTSFISLATKYNKHSMLLNYLYKIYSDGAEEA